MNKQNIKTTAVLLMLTLAFAACKKKDNIPVPEEQELITTMRLTITDSAGFNQSFIYSVENGFGSTTQGTVQIDTIKLAPNKNYYVTTELLNEKASPAENTTEEILAENEVHLFLYHSNPATGNGSISFSAGSKDNNNEPFNQTITFTTGNAGTGALTIDLMHEPTNKNGTTPASSGGETDAEAIYPVMVQ